MTATRVDPREGFRMRTIALLVLLVTLSTTASAEESATVDQYLSSILEISRIQCEKFDTAPIRKLEASGRKADAHALTSAHKGICECVPAHMKQLQSSLTETQRDEVMSESRFARELFKPNVMGPCAAEQLQSTYDEGCATRLAAEIKDSAGYCSCMASSIAKFSEVELVELGLENSDYVTAAANAKERGLAPPERPPMVRRIAAMHAECSNK